MPIFKLRRYLASVLKSLMDLDEHFQQLTELLDLDGHGHIIQNAMTKYHKITSDFRMQYRTLRSLLDEIQETEEPLKQQAKTLINSLRDFIFTSLTFCTSYKDAIPGSPADFQQYFLQSDLREYLSRQDLWNRELTSIFTNATNQCLEMAAKYQSVRAQSLKVNRKLLDMMTFPHFCEIEENVEDLKKLIHTGKSIIIDIYAYFFRIMKTRSFYTTEEADPVAEIQQMADMMREQLSECECKFVKKTALLRKLLDQLSPKEREEFERLMLRDSNILE